MIHVCDLKKLCCSKQWMKKLCVTNCWSAILLGSIMVSLGVIMRSTVIDNSHSATVSSSGKFLIYLFNYWWITWLVVFIDIMLFFAFLSTPIIFKIESIRRLLSVMNYNAIFVIKKAKVIWLFTFFAYNYRIFYIFILSSHFLR
jgi:hypothetical protein